LKKASRIFFSQILVVFFLACNLAVCLQFAERKEEANLRDICQAMVLVVFCLYQRSVRLCFDKGFFSFPKNKNRPLRSDYFFCEEKQKQKTSQKAGEKQKKFEGSNVNQTETLEHLN